MSADQCRRHARCAEQRTSRVEARANVAVGRRLDRNDDVCGRRLGLNARDTEPVLHRVRGSCNYTNLGVPGLHEDASRL